MVEEPDRRRPTESDDGGKSCPTCGRDDTGERDFCPGCGSYLRWDEDPEQADTAVLTPASDSELRREPTSTALEPVPPAATDEVVMAPAGLLSDTPTVVLPAVPDVQVTVRVPGRDEDPAEVDVATVEPDGRTVLLVPCATRAASSRATRCGSRGCRTGGTRSRRTSSTLFRSVPRAATTRRAWSSRSRRREARSPAPAYGRSRWWRSPIRTAGPSAPHRRGS